MSLILFAFVARARDGLPLSASTDFEHNQELQERKHQLRMLSKCLPLCPERGTIKGHDLNIYFTSAEGVSYMAICSSRLPIATAFCFLEDLRWEFTACFDSATVALANRPYPFLEFDSIIQKVKQQYSQAGGPRNGTRLAKVQEELKARPPRLLSFEEMMQSNGEANGHVDPVPGCGLSPRLEPVTAPGILSLVLNIMCASLNLIRGVHLIEYTFQDDYEGIWNVIAFLTAFTCCLCQCYLYLFYTSLKKPKTFSLLTLIILCNVYLYGLRNVWQLIFHIAVATLSTYLTLSRGLLDRMMDCGV
ncbi:vesicle-trafficking protein SEC22c [Brienomyrus brachyistius]|uniref:vesicle-trafficking protein SEC22c n=1 Tax=Brienomyrus brachyistius TaxID=42636 RepID=UPI0020B3B166|nr:vesicle-trafficking protein SEC22c [Brienomyrus brachyistius]